MAATTSRWIRTVNRLPEIHARLQRVQIDHHDWRKVLSTYDTPETLFYLDPPYVPGTRRSGVYAHELTLEDHEEITERILNIKGSVVLSGYAHKVYRPLEDANWERHEWDVHCSSAPQKGKGIGLSKHCRTECIWVKRSSIKRGFNLL